MPHHFSNSFIPDDEADIYTMSLGNKGNLGVYREPAKQTYSTPPNVTVELLSKHNETRGP